MTTQWRKMESWRIVRSSNAIKTWYSVMQRPYGRAECIMRDGQHAPCVFHTRAAALRAANKQNDLEGLPRVS